MKKVVKECVKNDALTSNSTSIRKRLNNKKSDQTEREEHIIKRAEEVFENKKIARGWLSSPLIALRDKRPIDVMRTKKGAEQVEAILGRIEHGGSVNLTV